MLALGLTAILLPLIEGRQNGWPVWTWVSFALAPVLLGAFLAHQWRRPRTGAARARCSTSGCSAQRSRSHAGLLTQLFLASVQASFFAYLALYLQLGRGLGALEAGLVFTILAVAYVAASGPAPKLTERYGRAVVAAGGVVPDGRVRAASSPGDGGDRRGRIDPHALSPGPRARRRRASGCAVSRR